MVIKKEYFILFLLFLLSYSMKAQKSNKKISYYGGFGLAISTGYTYISLQPGAIYHLNEKFKLGAGLQYTYLKSNKSYYGVNYTYNIFGFNSMVLYIPVKSLETSLEYENLYVKQNYNNIQNNFWSPALFAGIAYRYGNVAAGFKYNFLFDSKKSIYKDAFIPFVRIYF